jgi:hypothetical protein
VSDVENKYPTRLVKLVQFDLIEGVFTISYIFLTIWYSKKTIILSFSTSQWILIAGTGWIVLLHVLILLWIRQPTIAKRWSLRLGLPTVLPAGSLIFLVVLSITVLSATIPNIRGYIIRLAPLLVYVGLILLQLSVYQWILPYDGREITLVSKLEAMRKALQLQGYSLGITLMLCIPILFYNALRYDLPLGYAGMFTLMANEIAESSFKLPTLVPFYGPGGVPFAYPPLELYLMALFIYLKVPVLIYLRFFPPLFALLSLAALFFLALRISGSRLAAGFSTIIVATSFAFYEPHLWAAGVVRGPAFALALTGLNFYLRMIGSFRWRDMLLGGIFFGLTILSHLAYAVFFVVWMLSWLLAHPRQRNFLASGVLGMVGGIVALPWLVIMLQRYGLLVFRAALTSHGNIAFFSFFNDKSGLLLFIQNRIGSLLSYWLFAGLVVVGCLYLLIKARFSLLVILLAVTFIIYESNHYLVMIGGLIAGIVIARVYDWLTLLDGRYLNLFISRAFRLSMVSIVFTCFYLEGMRTIGYDQPTLSPQAFELAQFINQHISKDSNYLLVAQQDEAEWFPYLLERDPMIGQWGSEWLGTYYQQTSYLRQLRQCELDQDQTCLQELIVSVRKRPDYLITLKIRRRLNEDLSINPDWQEVYKNSRYLLWHYTGLH